MSLYCIVPIGTIRSPLICREQAPKQGREGAPAAWLALEPAYREGAKDLRPGQEILVLTWLARAERSALAVQSRDNETMPLTGVFSTRSADRPNPIGIHRVRILEITDGTRLRVSDLEAIDGTPIVDLKPVLDEMENGRTWKCAALDAARVERGESTGGQCQDPGKPANTAGYR